MTPRVARTVTGLPSRAVRTPTTRPSSTTSSSSGRVEPQRRAAASAPRRRGTRRRTRRRCRPAACRGPRRRARGTRTGTAHEARRRSTTARPSSQTSSVLSGSGIIARVVFHQSPILRESNGSTSIARPILPPGQLRVVVGVVGRAGEPHAVLLGGQDEVLDAVDERLLARARRGPVVVADGRLEVGQRLLAGVADPVALHQRVVRQPHATARHRGAAAPLVGPLHHQARSGPRRPRPSRWRSRRRRCRRRRRRRCGRRRCCGTGRTSAAPRDNRTTVSGWLGCQHAQPAREQATVARPPRRRTAGDPRRRPARVRRPRLPRPAERDRAGGGRGPGRALPALPDAARPGVRGLRGALRRARGDRRRTSTPTRSGACGRGSST